MNWLESIRRSAFTDELSKLAAGVTKGRIKKATITKLAKLDHDSDGNIIYRSKDEQNTNGTKQDPKNPYEMWTEDSDFMDNGFGYKRASFNEGKRYPSPEMEDEYDAANDNRHEDLEAATDNSPKYPTDHLSIKQAELDKFAAIPTNFAPKLGRRLGGNLKAFLKGPLGKSTTATETSVMEDATQKVKSLYQGTKKSIPFGTFQQRLNQGRTSMHTWQPSGQLA